MTTLFAEVAIPSTTEKLLTYRVPEEFHATLCAGCRVAVPLLNRRVIGIVVSLLSESQLPDVKSIIDVIDQEPSISRELLELAQWMAEYYCAPLGDVLRTVLFQGSTAPPKRIVRLLPPENPLLPPKFASSTLKAAIIEALEQRGDLSIGALQKKVGTRSIYAALNELAAMGYVRIEQEENLIMLRRKTEEIVLINESTRRRWQQWLAESGESKKIGKRLQLQRDLVNALIVRKNGRVFVKQLLLETGLALSVIRALEKIGVVGLSNVEVLRSGQDVSPAAPVPSIILNPHQANAIDTLCAAVGTKRFSPFLLHGVTGSGKTQVYIEAIRYALEKGRTAIVLVPEISLTSQIVQRFRSYFGDKVAAMHSRMTTTERRETWRLAHEGKCSIVIGPRSALFAPLKNLGVIVVDEEHESAYKQFDQMPRYHGRDVAVVRAKCENAVVVLGSATPSFESYFNAVGGKYTLLELPERIDDARLPAIEIVDMVVERKQKLLLFKEQQKLKLQERGLRFDPARIKYEGAAVSDRLKDLINDRLTKGEGIILLQNRRGFSPILECLECGYVEQCDFCNISLTYHATMKHLRCHYCGFSKNPPTVCKNCGGAELDYKGFGTQRVEEELLKSFPGVKVVRMDLDTTTEPGSHGRLLKKFATGEVDILLGTQMVAKGLDFSRVTLVGVISADTQMLLPDFRSAERTFQLLTQVAGRAGRSTTPGEVVIQTRQPHHPSLKYVLKHDFCSFYAEEMVFRAELSYPPYSRIVLIEFNGEKEKEVVAASHIFVDALKRQPSDLRVLGPAPAAITRLRNVFRWQVVIKSVKSGDPSGAKLRGVLTAAMESYREKGAKNAIKVIIDVDPVGMM